MFIIQKVNLTLGRLLFKNIQKLKKLCKKFQKIKILSKKFDEFCSLSGAARMSSTYLR